MEIKGTDMTATTTANETFNGWANYETWNASLWISNDEFLYNTARACVTFAEDGESVWSKFQRCMTDGQIGRMLGKTEDGVSWNDPSIDAAEMEEMMRDLWTENQSGNWHKTPWKSPQNLPYCLYEQNESNASQRL